MQRLNRYLRTGGMILFDTRDADMARLRRRDGRTGASCSSWPRRSTFRRSNRSRADHVLTRTFYLLQDFPAAIVAAMSGSRPPPPDAELVEGMPFRNLNDNVTPVVIGGNDWAAAWATDERGQPHLPGRARLSPASASARSRYRFGVNLIMHVLTGNYKSDQVHVPALLDRLGQ